MRCVVAFIALFALGTFVAGDVQALEIQVAPHVLVLSSDGDNVTIHTNFVGDPNPPEDPEDPVEVVNVDLKIESDDGDTRELEIVDEFLDDCGRYVVRCTRQDAAAAFEEFKGKRTTATVTLCIGTDCGSEEITVIRGKK